LDAAVADYCEELLGKMPEIIRATRVQLNFWKNMSWGLTVQMAREWLTVHAASSEVAEGLASFHEKRSPDFEKLRKEIEEAGRK
jgi:1,4-dihydroxy-2-naphthoyl-CoA synthase